MTMANRAMAPQQSTENLLWYMELRVLRNLFHNDHGQQGNGSTTVNRKPALVHGTESIKVFFSLILIWQNLLYFIYSYDNVDLNLGNIIFYRQQLYPLLYIECIHLKFSSLDFYLFNQKLNIYLFIYLGEQSVLWVIPLRLLDSSRQSDIKHS